MNLEMGKRIRIFRDAADLSQQEVADRLGMNRSTYSRRESNGNFDINIIMKLADIFNIHVDHLLYDKKRAEQPKPPIDMDDDIIMSRNDREDLKILQSLNIKQRKIARDFLIALHNGNISVDD